MTAAALFDRNGWGEPFDRLDVGLLDLIKELAGVGAQRLHVFALPFGEDGVEREGTLA